MEEKDLCIGKKNANKTKRSGLILKLESAQNRLRGPDVPQDEIPFYFRAPVPSASPNQTRRLVYCLLNTVLWTAAHALFIPFRTQREEYTFLLSSED